MKRQNKFLYGDKLTKEMKKHAQTEKFFWGGFGAKQILFRLRQKISRR